MNYATAYSRCVRHARRTADELRPFVERVHADDREASEDAEWFGPPDEQRLAYHATNLGVLADYLEEVGDPRHHIVRGQLRHWQENPNVARGGTQVREESHVEDGTRGHLVRLWDLQSKNGPVLHASWQMPEDETGTFPPVMVAHLTPEQARELADSLPEVGRRLLDVRPQRIRDSFHALIDNHVARLEEHRRRAATTPKADGG